LGAAVKTIEIHLVDRKVQGFHVWKGVGFLWFSFRNGPPYDQGFPSWKTNDANYAELFGVTGIDIADKKQFRSPPALPLTSDHHPPCVGFFPSGRLQQAHVQVGLAF
jgi:hypothetical protein